MTKKSENFQEGIHTPNFWDEYLNKQICATVMTDHSREKESLNGLWRYAIDQYDSCLRNKWFAEKTHDEDGRAFPPDCSFDNWEVMPIPCCWNIFDEKLFLY